MEFTWRGRRVLLVVPFWTTLLFTLYLSFGIAATAGIGLIFLPIAVFSASCILVSIANASVVLAEDHVRYAIFHTVERERVRKVTVAELAGARSRWFHAFIQIDDGHDVMIDSLHGSPRAARDPESRVLRHSMDISLWAGVPLDISYRRPYEPNCWPYAEGVPRDDRHGRPTVPKWLQYWDLPPSKGHDPATTDTSTQPGDSDRGDPQYEQLLVTFGPEVAERDRRLRERAQQLNELAQSPPLGPDCGATQEAPGSGTPLQGSDLTVASHHS
ncbi:hypothetical protein [Raineyella fluvialis]|uniref:Uncharacterized protein n=1 Tax=Raineyella fluvialis TaxID=2662261 RepID=A0A5Q2F9Y0_9ACTN|nr:hypothetical protein [Raineyella fluvialis]QGF23609.1 hypothetical protein Rai3103_07945 [Raineyella fluvialis]